VYDMADVLAQMPPVSGQRWQIGPQNINKLKTAKKRTLITPKILLSLALGAMIIILVGLIVVSVKKIDSAAK
jgi:hypothetical protein